MQDLDSDNQVREILNDMLIKRFPFLFSGMDPKSPEVDCTKRILAEYDKINSKQSSLSASQRFEIKIYMDSFHKFRQRKANDAISK